MTEVSSKEREGLSCPPEIMADTMALNPFGHPPPDIMPKGLIMNGHFFLFFFIKDYNYLPIVGCFEFVTFYLMQV